MDRYPFIAMFERHGAWLSAVMAFGFLALVLIIGWNSLNPAIVAFAALGAAVVWLLLRTLTEIIRLLSETLIPRP